MPVRHGESPHRIRTTEYETWVQMKARCSNRNNPNWRYYGARGITVCKRWSKSYEAFLKDVGRRPSRDHTLGRIENSKGYFPGNVRWETYTEQNRNKSDNKVFSVNGVPMCVSELTERSGLKRVTLVSRLRHGWSLEDALKTPLKKGRLITVGGQRKTSCGWSKITGVKASTILVRLKLGWKPRDAVKTPASPRLIEVNGKRHSIAEWSKITGTSQDVIRYRLKVGWTCKDAILKSVRNRCAP